MRFEMWTAGHDREGPGTDGAPYGDGISSRPPPGGKPRPRGEGLDLPERALSLFGGCSGLYATDLGTPNCITFVARHVVFQ